MKNIDVCHIGCINSIPKSNHNQQYEKGLSFGLVIIKINWVMVYNLKHVTLPVCGHHAPGIASGQLVQVPLSSFSSYENN